MKHIIQKLSLLAAAIFSIALSYGQNPTVVAIESQLTDIEGEFVTNTQIDISLQVLNSSGQLAYEKSNNMTTNENGEFHVFIEDVPALFVNGQHSDPAVIQLSITSPEDDSWLEEEEFVVKYLMTLEGGEANPEFSLTRMEGQKLNVESLSDIWRFGDIYPFAYIKSIFLLSMNEDIADAESLLLVAAEIFGTGDQESMGDEEMEEEAAPSRGVKSGFAVGGVKKK